MLSLTDLQLWPIFGSVPSRKRLTLGQCRQKMSMVRNTPKKNMRGSPRAKTQIVDNEAAISAPIAGAGGGAASARTGRVMVAGSSGAAYSQLRSSRSNAAAKTSSRSVASPGR